MSKGLEGIIAAKTSISSIIGSTLTYRGYTIEDLAAHASFEEVLFLLWEGRLPNSEELHSLEKELFSFLHLPDKMKVFLRSFSREGNSMEVLRTSASALPLFIPYDSAASPLKQATMLQAQITSLVAAIARHRKGKVVLEPLEGRSLAENFLYMMSGVEPTAIEIEAMNKALILHADHELNASTFSSRVTVATLSDIYSGLTSAIGTLKGPLHGGANEQVMKMLEEVGDIDNVDAYIHGKLERKEKIMGMGHRVYREGDPRAAILKEMSQKLTKVAGDSKWYEMSEKIEALILKEKGLKPNVDFYSASVYHSMNIPGEMFTPLFAVSRTSGWVAHMLEQYSDNRLIRPRAEYVGETHQEYVPIEKR